MVHKHTYRSQIKVREYPLPLVVLKKEPTTAKEPPSSIVWVLPGYTLFNPEYLDMIRTEG